VSAGSLSVAVTPKTTRPGWLTACALRPCAAQVRDISTNEAWQDAMHLSVPVLALLDSQGQEVRNSSDRDCATGSSRQQTKRAEC
jgi:hypothetical protein